MSETEAPKLKKVRTEATVLSCDGVTMFYPVVVKHSDVPSIQLRVRANVNGKHRNVIITPAFEGAKLGSFDNVIRMFHRWPKKFSFKGHLTMQQKWIEFSRVGDMIAEKNKDELCNMFYVCDASEKFDLVNQTMTEEGERKGNRINTILFKIVEVPGKPAIETHVFNDRKSRDFYAAVFGYDKIIHISQFTVKKYDIDTAKLQVGEIYAGFGFVLNLQNQQFQGSGTCWISDRAPIVAGEKVYKEAVDYFKNYTASKEDTTFAWICGQAE